MNCPQCEEMVGPNQYSRGKWQNEFDDAGLFVRCWRWLFVRCRHCGMFRVVCEPDGHGGDKPVKIFGPFFGSRQNSLVPEIPEIELAEAQVA